MGRKYLEVLTAKTMLGIRKKVHHPRQNQKAFWDRGCGVSTLCWAAVLSGTARNPQHPTDSKRGAGT